MKKWMKWTLIAGGVLMVSGIGLITAAAVRGGENCLMGIPRYERMYRHGQMHGYQAYVPAPENGDEAYVPTPENGDEAYVLAPENGDQAYVSAPENGEQVYTGIRELDLENCSGNAWITESDQLAEGEIQVKQLGDGYEYSVWQEGAELKISVPRQVRKSFPGWVLDPELTMKDVEIIVPAGFRFQELNIETVSGSFTADVIYANELSLEAVSGSIEILNGSAGAVDAENVSGTISCMAVAETEVSVENVSGDTVLYMAGDIGNYDYDVERAGGQIVLTGSTVVDYSGNVGNTRIDNKTGREVDLECVGGSIMLQYQAALENAL